MNKATKAIQQLKSIDLVLDIRDVRIPFSSRNPFLQSLIPKSTPSLIVYNKADLVSSRNLHSIQSIFRSIPKWSHSLDSSVYSYPFRWIRSKEVSYLHNKHIPLWPIVPSYLIPHHKKAQVDICFTNSKDRKSIRSFYKTLTRCLKSYNPTQKQFNILVTGIPNVGKSTLLNALKSLNNIGSSLSTGAKPGVTRSVSISKISQNPLIYAYDSPGVMVPHTIPGDFSLKIASTFGLPGHLVNIYGIAEYLLFFLNKRANLSTKCAFGTLKSYSVDFLNDYSYLTSLSHLNACLNDAEFVYSCISNLENSLKPLQQPEYISTFPSISQPCLNLEELLFKLNPSQPEAAAQTFVTAYRDGKFPHSGSIDSIPTVESAGQVFHHLYGRCPS